jgi:hypothetical protein
MTVTDQLNTTLLKGYKLCPECGSPILEKGQQHKHPDDYRHARRCQNGPRFDPRYNDGTVML